MRVMARTWYGEVNAPVRAAAQLATVDDAAAGRAEPSATPR